MAKKQVYEKVQKASLNAVAPVESVEKKVTDPCWNCGAQLESNVCSECGFDKSLVYNLELEAEKARQKQQAAPATK